MSKGVLFLWIFSTLNAIGEPGEVVASMEVVLLGDQSAGYPSVTKNVRGVYSQAGTVVGVEGDLQQVHPSELCSDFPTSGLKYGNIYVIKLESPSTNLEHPYFCQSFIQQAKRAIQLGATAVVIVVTAHPESLQEVSEIPKPFERPVIFVESSKEEDKLLSILSIEGAAFMRVNPIHPPRELVGTEKVQESERADGIIFIGISIIMLLLIVALVILGVFVVKMRASRRQMRLQARWQLLDRIITQKYSANDTIRQSPASLTEDAESCTICLENYRQGEDLRLLPCAHRFHKRCIDRWLLQHSTCPCCCGDITELLDNYAVTQQKLTALRTATPGHDERGSMLGSAEYSAAHRPLSVHKHAGKLIESPVSCAGLRYCDNCESFALECDPRHLKQLSYDGDCRLTQQQKYLLQRLHEIERQRPPSATVSETESLNQLSIVSCYGSMVELNSSLPPENDFIGDNCQGSPQKCAEIILCDLDVDDTFLRTYKNSKSTVPSVESVGMSPRVSESESTCKSKQCERTSERTGENRCMVCGQSHYLPGIVLKQNKRGCKLRTVRFREPESKRLSNFDSSEDLPCQCKSCQAHCLRSRSLVVLQASDKRFSELISIVAEPTQMYIAKGEAV